MRRRIGLCLLTALFLGSCGGAAAVSTVDVDLYEWGVGVSSPSLNGGPVTVRMINAGTIAHTLVVTASDGRAIAAGPLLSSGEGAQMTVHLEPGKYEFTCRIVIAREGGLADHYSNGMVSVVRVGP